MSGKAGAGAVHGHTCGRKYSPTYLSWLAMKYRCLNQANKAYPRYGGRGIRICERWMKFENFLADMGERSDGMTLDRIDNDGHYEPDNCRWATAVEQNTNRRDNRTLDLDGRRQTLSQWARELGIHEKAIASRLRMGWSVARALDPSPSARADWKTNRACEACGASFMPVQRRSRYCSAACGKRTRGALAYPQNKAKIMALRRERRASNRAAGAVR